MTFMANILFSLENVAIEGQGWKRGETFSKERMLARNRVVIVEVVKSTQILVIVGKTR